MRLTLLSAKKSSLLTQALIISICILLSQPSKAAIIITAENDGIGGATFTTSVGTLFVGSNVVSGGSYGILNTDILSVGTDVFVMSTEVGTGKVGFDGLTVAAYPFPSVSQSTFSPSVGAKTLFETHPSGRIVVENNLYSGDHVTVSTPIVISFENTLTEMGLGGVSGPVLLWQGLAGGGLSSQDNQIILQKVPEPGTLMLLIPSFGLLCVRRRKKSCC